MFFIYENCICGSDLWDNYKLGAFFAATRVTSPHCMEDLAEARNSALDGKKELVHSNLQQMDFEKYLKQNSEAK